MKYYKCLDNGNSCHGGSLEWSLPKDGKPGDWMPRIDRIETCVSGYHLCRERDLVDWLSDEIYEAEGRGEKIVDNNKVVFQEARLIRKLDKWNDRTARLFSADCAGRVLHLYEDKCPDDKRPRLAILASRDFANGLITEKQLAAARAAARDAAWAAARAAARAAAWAAARAGVRDAARVASRDAARDAAWAAAWAGVRDAERKWQTVKLMEYLT